MTLGLVAQAQAAIIQERQGDGLTAVDITRFNEFKNRRNDYMIVAAPMLIGSALSLTIGSLLYYLDTPRLEP